MEPDPEAHTCSLIPSCKLSTRQTGAFLIWRMTAHSPQGQLPNRANCSELTRNLTWVRLRSHFSRGLAGLKAVGSRPVLSFTLALS